MTMFHKSATGEQWARDWALLRLAAGVRHLPPLWRELAAAVVKRHRGNIHLFLFHVTLTTHKFSLPARLRIDYYGMVQRTTPRIDSLLLHLTTT